MALLLLTATFLLFRGNFDQIFDQIFGQVLDQVFGQGLGEGKPHKYSVQYYLDRKIYRAVLHPPTGDKKTKRGSRY